MKKPTLVNNNNYLIFSVEDDEIFEYAYDIFCNEEKIKFINYSRNNQFELDITNYEGIFKIWVFKKDLYGKITSEFSNSVFFFKSNPLNYKNIREDLLSTGPKLFSLENVNLPCLYFKKIKQVKHLTILLSGFVNREKQSIPVFNRWSWSNKFPGDVICIADPTLELDENIFIGWYVGSKNYDLSLEITELIKNIAEAKKIPYSNIVFYGSSAGGFAALKFASLIEGSTAVCINPQIDATKHYQEYVSNLLNTAYEGQTIEEVKNNFPKRFSINEAWKNNNNSKIIYVQNKYDDFHYKEHFLPFAKKYDLSLIDGLSKNGKYFTFLYEDEQGHGPEPENLIQKIIIQLKEFSFSIEKKDHWKKHIKKTHFNIPLIFEKSNAFSNDISENTIDTIYQENNFPTKYLNNIEYYIFNSKLSSAEKAIIEGVYFIPNYGEINLGNPINWNEIFKKEDNFKWYMNSWFYLPILLNYIQKNENVALNFLYNQLKQWEKISVNIDDHSSFIWNDHSTSNRLKHLSEAFIFLISKKLLNPKLSKLIIELVYKHILILMENSFYSKGTNHGIDQAFSLVLASTVFNFLDISKEAKEIGIERLRFEFDYAFSEESIHLENSPEYHNVILASALTINNFVNILTSEYILKKPLNEFCNEALEYMAYITRPDGLVPPIGDSEQKYNRNIFDYLDKFDKYDSFLYKATSGKKGKWNLESSKVFDKSGYAIFQGPDLSSLDELLHMIVKCGFKSSYHRQDDDTNIILYAFSEDWLIDGGLYKHDHNDKIRQYFRSASSHNVLFPKNVKNINRELNNKVVAKMENNSTNLNSIVSTTTNMYEDYIYSRKVIYNNKYSITIEDNLENISLECPVVQLWHFDKNKTFTIIDNICYVISMKYNTIMKISFGKKYLKEILLITDEEDYALRSKTYGKLEQAPYLRIEYDHIDEPIVTHITFLKEMQ